MADENERWSRLQPFDRDGVLVRIMAFAGYDYSAATSVFTKSSSTEVFHADKYCHRLYQGDTITIDGTEKTTIHAHPLEKVMTSWTDPIKPCSHCTQDIETTAEIATEIDGIPEELLCYFEPGDQRVSTTVTYNEDGTTEVKESATEVY